MLHIALPKMLHVPDDSQKSEKGKSGNSISLWWCMFLECAKSYSQILRLRID